MNLTAALGAAALLTAMATALFAVAASVIGLRSGNGPLLRAGRRSVYATALFLTVAMAILAVALLRNDFSIAHVASVSSTDMRPIMKWASLYSGQPGSLLYWTWLMSLFMAAFAWVTVPRIPWGGPHAIAMCGGILAAFLVALLFFASPFRISVVTPEDGVGLNPLLVDPTMLIHPPVMLAGLISTVIPFTMGAAALMAGRIDSAWIRAVRHWALLSWLLLSVGNILGAWWAYTVLGWGGYWGWDPVENSALLPLLPMTAFVHSMMVQERRGMLKLWNLALVFAAFALAVFGTFNVRSGLVASVHSFAVSEVGPYFLVLLGATLVGSIALLAWRSPQLRRDHDFESLASRESSLIVNNYLFTAIMLIILGGTLFPVFSELVRGVRITVGPPFYDDVVGPLLIVLVALIAVGTVLPWRRASNATLRRRFRDPLLVLGASLVVLWLIGVQNRFALAGMSAGIVLISVTLREFVLGASGASRATGQFWPLALLGLFARDQRRYGGYLVHIGIGVMAIAIVGSSIYQEQVRVVVAPGETFELGDYTIRYDGLTERPRNSDGIESEVIANLVIFRGDREVGTLDPGRRFFTNFPQQPMARVAIKTSLREDLYIFVQGWDPQGVAEFNGFVNPLMAWLWIGAGIYTLGGLIAFMPRPVEVPQRVAIPDSGAAQRA